VVPFLLTKSADYILLPDRQGGTAPRHLVRLYLAGPILTENQCILNGRSKPRLDSKSWLLNMMAMSGSSS
jgi:hypothetical protein